MTFSIFGVECREGRKGGIGGRGEVERRTAKKGNIKAVVENRDMSNREGRKN